MRPEFNCLLLALLTGGAFLLTGCHPDCSAYAHNTYTPTAGENFYCTQIEEIFDVDAVLIVRKIAGSRFEYDDTLARPAQLPESVTIGPLDSCIVHKERHDETDHCSYNDYFTLNFENSAPEVATIIAQNLYDDAMDSYELIVTTVDTPVADSFCEIRIRGTTLQYVTNSDAHLDCFKKNDPFNRISTHLYRWYAPE